MSILYVDLSTCEVILSTCYFIMSTSYFVLLICFIMECQLVLLSSLFGRPASCLLVMFSCPIVTSHQRPGGNKIQTKDCGLPSLVWV